MGLVDAIGTKQGFYTIAHQCKSSDLFLSNSQKWLDFTACNPGAVVMGYISGDQSRRNCPMRYIIRNGAFEETTLLSRHHSSAYYFECSAFQSRLKEVYNNDGSGLNLAYCCGGYNSAVKPLQDVANKEKFEFEYTIECYGVSTSMRQGSEVCQIGGTLVNVDHVSPIHPGGDQILYQLQDIANEEISEKAKASSSACPISGPTTMTTTPDQSITFSQLHPHSYNLHRCLRTPYDADSEAFMAFLGRKAMSKSVMLGMATKYAEVALAAPDDSKVVRIASELQATTLRRQVQSGELDGAEMSARYLEALLNYVPSQDEDAHRWSESLDEYQESFHHRDDHEE